MSDQIVHDLLISIRVGLLTGLIYAAVFVAAAVIRIGSRAATIALGFFVTLVVFGILALVAGGAFFR